MSVESLELESGDFSPDALDFSVESLVLGVALVSELVALLSGVLIVFVGDVLAEACFFCSAAISLSSLVCSCFTSFLNSA